MKEKISILVTVIILVGFGVECNNPEKDKNEVRKTFDNYKNAIIYDKYDEAANCLDSRTLAYYDTLLWHIQYSDSAIVASLPVMDQLLVLMVRDVAATKEIIAFNGKSLFAYCIKNKLIDKNDVTNAHIDKVEIDGKFAKGRLITESMKDEKEDSPKLSNAVWLNFYKEANQWKIDMTSLLYLANKIFAGQVSGMKLSVSEFAIEAIVMHTGKIPNPEIWKPTLKAIR
jgi:hypothetical protein